MSGHVLPPVADDPRLEADRISVHADLIAVKFRDGQLSPEEAAALVGELKHRAAALFERVSEEAA